MRRSAHSLLLVFANASAALAATRIVPQPQYVEPLLYAVTGATAEIVIGPEHVQSRQRMALAAEFLRRELEGARASIRMRPSDRASSGPVIHLWDYAADPNPPVSLNFIDRETLSSRAHFDQSYVVRMPDARSVWVICASEQAVLFGAMSVLQLIRAGPREFRIEGAYIRDYPDFEFRAASDWLLRIELSHWSLDRGQGVEAFARLCEHKLDRALRFKINMVLMDGFGWYVEKRFTGYGALMRRLNRYARARGIHLIFGGYGAAYDLARRPGEYLGQVFENRAWYPDGPKYRCFGDPHQGEGSCRANEELNRMKADELRAFVEAVEPGALDIHHEDCCAFNEFASAWTGRCERCRKRWPNEAFAAPDGGAGALAHGYAALLNAINQVKHADSGYDASRDCQVIFVSPVYQPNSPSSEDWGNVLELWRNIAAQLPAAPNVQIGLREIFPQVHGGERWVEEFNRAMRSAGRNFGGFLFFIGGADNFLSDYPLTGAPAMNALFQGARTIYNASGDFYQEPMEIINAEYSWNARSTGFYRVPLQYAEGVSLRARYAYSEGQPPEIFGADGIYERACELLYGQEAGRIMARYYRESAWTPDREPRRPESDKAFRRHTSYIPMMFDRVYAIPAHWLHLRADVYTWERDITDQGYLRRLAALEIDRSELHRRLARRWSLTGALNAKGATYIREALAAGPLPSSVEDLRFLQTAFRVYQPLLEGLSEFHQAMALYFARGRDAARIQQQLDTALRSTKRARQMAAEAFPRPVDPMGADVGAIRSYTEKLEQVIEKMRSEK